MIMKNNRLKGIMLTAGILLLIPFLATVFTDTVDWGLFDFVVAGVLLVGTGLAIELVMRKVENPQNRLILSAIILVALLLIWAELAVGIFGTPLAGN